MNLRKILSNAMGNQQDNFTQSSALITSRLTGNFTVDNNSTGLNFNNSLTASNSGSSPSPLNQFLIGTAVFAALLVIYLYLDKHWVRRNQRYQLDQSYRVKENNRREHATETPDVVNGLLRSL